MLYLIRTFGAGKKTALKIGYTDKIETRMNQYRLHNPFYQLVTSRQGSMEDELILHLYLRAIGFKQDWMKEWFYDDYRIGQIFHKPIHSLEEMIWKDREELFCKEDFKSSGIKKTLYERLRDKFWNGHNLQIDLDWKWCWYKNNRKGN